MSEKESSDEQAHKAAASALSTCQLVEHVMKLYLSTVHLLIAEKCDAKIPYHFSGDDYEDVPLGGLLKAFKKLNDNSDLQGRLEKFRKDRNWVAHQLFADYFVRGNQEDTAAQKLKVLVRLDMATSEADELIAELMREVTKLRAANGKSGTGLSALIQQAAKELSQ